VSKEVLRLLLEVRLSPSSRLLGPRMQRTNHHSHSLDELHKENREELVDGKHVIPLTVSWALDVSEPSSLVARQIYSPASSNLICLITNVARSSSYVA
jgi:hypothetical protein